MPPLNRNLVNIVFTLSTFIAGTAGCYCRLEKLSYHMLTDKFLKHFSKPFIPIAVVSQIPSLPQPWDLVSFNSRH